jgi:hypothetical protein
MAPTDAYCLDPECECRGAAQWICNNEECEGGDAA